MKLELVAYVPDLAFDLLSSVVAHTRGVSFATDDSNESVTLLDRRLRFVVIGQDIQRMENELILIMSAPPLPWWC